MCTSIMYNGCMGRNFDYEISYKESPRTYNKEQYEIKGIVADITDYPLFYDAMNEHGLCIAGLNFEGNAYYPKEPSKDKQNIKPWELPVAVLGRCKTLKEAENFLKESIIIDEPFNNDLPNTPLHWMICDKENSIVVEQTKEEGLQVYHNEYNVLTNNPPFPKQERCYQVLMDVFSDEYDPDLFKEEFYSRGIGTFGLSGGLTSQERFMRATYYKERLIASNDKFNPVIETFHLLDTVKQIYGATPIENKYEYTIYSVVYDIDNYTLYMKKYDDFNIKEV